MNFKGFLVGSVSAALLLGPQVALSWTPDSVQRGWVDFVGPASYPGPIFGPSEPIGLFGWACVRPDLPHYGVPSTNVAVYQGGPPGVGVRVTVLEHREPVNRTDVVAAGACAQTNNGFKVWIAKTYPGPRAAYYVVFEGPYGWTTLEGQH
jgi:hypothetical protein